MHLFKLHIRQWQIIIRRKGLSRVTYLDEVTGPDVDEDLVGVIKNAGDVERRRERDQHLLAWSIISFQ